MSPGPLAEARHAVLPDGICSSAFPAVQQTCARLGLLFDPWQADLNRCVLAKGADGLYAADTVALSIPRQVGKTWNVGALVFADCIINAQTTTIWTAHRFKVSRETFDMMRALARSPQLAPHIDETAITTAAGNEVIPFRNGSRIVFAARERGAIRGFSKVRRLILDEAQILTESTLSDIAPTMNQAENPQVILMGTPPKATDPSEVFSRLRGEALSGTARRLLYVELSAPADADWDDRGAWRAANPSFPSRTPERAVERMRHLLGGSFGREALGIWDSDSTSHVIDPQAWLSQAVTEAPGDAADVAYGVDIDPARTVASIAVAVRDDDRVHVEVAAHASIELGSRWVHEWLVQRRRRGAVLVQGSSQAAALVPELVEHQVRIKALGSADMARACGGLFDDVAARRLTHLDDPVLSTALAAATMRPLSKTSGGWTWGRGADTSADITPLVAITLARHALVTSRQRTGKATFV